MEVRVLMSASAAPQGARPPAEFSREELEKELEHDYSSATTGVVPLSERRSLYHFIALWTTFAAGFTYLFLGFQYHDSGYGLGKAVAAGALGALCYLAYALPASYLGSRSGQTHSLLTRSIFGMVGSVVVSLLLIGVAAGWTAFAWNLLAVMYDGLFSWGHLALIGVLLAVVGIVNNLLGFTGITAFARYVVAPVMILWMLYLVIKGFAQIPGLGRTPPIPQGGFPVPFLSGVALAIGSVMWGNEPDTWRYGKPRFWWPLAPYAIALAIGMVLFVMGGWMMAERSQAGAFNFGPAYRATVEFSLFGALWLGFIIATVLQVAINDGNYYEVVNAGQNLLGQLRNWRRWYTCLLAILPVAALTWWFVANGKIELNFFKVAGWSAIALPCTTIVMCADQFLLPRLLNVRRPVGRIPEWRNTALGNWPAIVAVLAALAFGAYGLQLFPGQKPPRNLGLVPVEAWALAGVLYLALAALVARAPAGKALLGFAHHLRGPGVPEEAAPAPAPPTAPEVG
jgi:purine-cytosine permease-like protein